MASKNVIREDVVQISFSVNDNPINDLVKSLQSLQSSVTKVVDDITNKFSKAGNSANNIADGLKSTSREVASTADKFNPLVDKLRQLSNIKLKEIPQYLKLSATAAKDFISNIKTNAFSKLTSGVSKLHSGLLSLRNVNLNSIIGAFDKVKTSIGNISFSKIVHGVVDFGHKIKDVASTSWNNLISGISKIGSAFQHVGQIAVNIGSKIKSIVSAPYNFVLKVKDEVSKQLDNISSKIFNIKNAIVSLATTGLAAKAVGFVADQQDLEAQYKILLGSAEAAQDTVQSLIDFAGTTPYAREDIFQANRQLLIFGGTALATEKTLRLVGDTAAGTGQNFSDTAYRIGQVYTALKSGNSPGVYIKSLQQTGALSSELADKLGELAESGATFETKWAAVEEALGRYSGTMEEMSKNMSNLILGVKTFVKQKFIVPLGQGIVDSIQPALVEFKKWRSENAETITAIGEKIRELSRTITQFLIDKIKIVIKFVGQLKSAWENFAQSNSGQKILESLHGIGDFLYQHGNTILGIITAITTAIAGIAIVGKISKFVSVLKFLISPLGIIAGLIVLVALAMSGKLQPVTEKVTSMVGSFSDVFKNLLKTFILEVLPKIEEAIPKVIEAIADIFSEVADFITENLPLIIVIAVQLIESLAMGLIQNIDKILQSAFTILQALVDGIVQNLPIIINVALQLILAICIGIANNLPWIVQMALQIILSLVDTIVEMLPTIIEMGVQLLIALIQGIIQSLPLIIQAAIQAIVKFVTGLIENLPLLIKMGIELLFALISGLIQAIPQLIAAIPQIVNALWNGLMSINWLELGWNIITSIGQGIWNGIKGLFGIGQEAGEEATNGITSGISSGNLNISSAATNVSDTATTGFKPDYSAIQSYGSTATSSFSSGLSSELGNLTSTTDGISNTLTNSFDEINLSSSGKNSITTLADGMNNASSGVKSSAAMTATSIQGTFGEIDLYSTGQAIMQGLQNGLLSMEGSLKNAAQSIANSIKTTVNSALDIHSPSKEMMKTGQFAGAGLKMGLESTMPDLKTTSIDISDILKNTSLSEYTPESSHTTSHKTNYESNTYSPQFNLTVNGSATDRATQRQIKEFMKEAMQEAFQSMERRRPALVEV